MSIRSVRWHLVAGATLAVFLVASCVGDGDELVAFDGSDPEAAALAPMEPCDRAVEIVSSYDVEVVSVGDLGDPVAVGGLLDELRYQMFSEPIVDDAGDVVDVSDTEDRVMRSMESTLGATTALYETPVGSILVPDDQLAPVIGGLAADDEVVLFASDSDELIDSAVSKVVGVTAIGTRPVAFAVALDPEVPQWSRASHAECLSRMLNPYLAANPEARSELRRALDEGDPVDFLERVLREAESQQRDRLETDWRERSPLDRSYGEHWAPVSLTDDLVPTQFDLGISTWGSNGSRVCVVTDEAIVGCVSVSPPNAELDERREMESLDPEVLAALEQTEFPGDDRPLGLNRVSFDAPSDATFRLLAFDGAIDHDESERRGSEEPSLNDVAGMGSGGDRDASGSVTFPEQSYEELVDASS